MDIKRTLPRENMTAEEIIDFYDNMINPRPQNIKIFKELVNKNAEQLDDTQLEKLIEFFKRFN